MHSVEMNISDLQQSQVQSKPDLQPAAVKNPKFRKGRQSLEELLGGSFHHELTDEASQKSVKEMKEKLQIKTLQDTLAWNRKIFNKPKE